LSNGNEHRTVRDDLARRMQATLLRTMDEFTEFMRGYADGHEDEEFSFADALRDFAGNMVDNIHDGADHAEAMTGARYLADLTGIDLAGADDRQ
jgi:hypothetical protein